jgi:hypothetical protein
MTQGMPFFSYLGRKLRPDMVGDWTDLNPKSTTNFLKWWNTTTKPSMEKAYHHFDQKFQELMYYFTEGLNNESFSGSPNWVDSLTESILGYKTEIDPAGLFYWGDAKRSLTKSHLQEINVYLTVLSDLEKSLKKDTYQKSKTVIDPKQTLMAQMLVPLYARIESQKKLVEKIQKIYTEVESLRYVNGKVIQSSTPRDYNINFDDLVGAIEDYKKHISGLKFPKTSQSAALLAVESLEKSAMSLGVYVLNTQTTNFGLTQDIETYLRNSSRVKETTQGQRPMKQNNSPWAK